MAGVATLTSDQSGQTEKQEKVEQEIYNPILGRTQKLMNCPKPDPAPAGGEEKEFRALEFHSLALEIRKYFDDAELEVSDTVCGHLAIMMQKHMEAARTSAFNECKEKTIEIVSKAKADTPQTFEYIALEKVKQKILALNSNGNDQN